LILKRNGKPAGKLYDQRKWNPNQVSQARTHPAGSFSLLTTVG